MYYRPNFHFSPLKGYMNDPNGLVYNSKRNEYHLHFQHQPGFLSNHGQHIWGHAISNDLIHWEEKEAVLPYVPDDLPASGSAVIDINNTSGLFSDEIEPEDRIVLVYAIVNYTENINWDISGNQQVGIAYSLDAGKTYIKYEHNPVISNPNNKFGEHFRDPKVIWLDNDDGGLWLMIIGGGRLRIFTSHNLIDWRHDSDIDDIFGYEAHSECPDIFRLPIDGNMSNMKWVVTGLGQYYMVGELTQNTEGLYHFEPDTPQKRVYSGASATNAIQSFYNIPENRCIWIGWLVDTTAEHIPGKTWNGSQTLPNDFTLRDVEGEPCLFSYPSKEADILHSEKLLDISDILLDENSENILRNVKSDLFDLEMEFEIIDANKVEMCIRSNGEQKTGIVYDCLQSTLEVNLKNSSDILNLSGTAFSLPQLRENIVKIRIISDSSVISVFGNEGYYHFSQLFYPPENANKFALNVSGGSIRIKKLDIFSMKTALNFDEEKENDIKI